MVETVEKSLRHSCRSELTVKEFRYLRMVIVTTAVYWRLSSQLRPTEMELTGPLNVPAPGRRQSVYIALRLRTDLCF